MQEFTLPHRHGKRPHLALLQKELEREDRFDRVSEIFRQLGDPVRVRIFWLLCHQEECVVNIAAIMKMSPPAVCHHLASMQNSGLLICRRDGKEVYYHAAHTEECRLLHGAAERIMAITCPAAKPALSLDPEEIVYNVHQYLTEHMAERITVEELARKFLTNPTTLRAAFRKVYGNSLAAHMKEHRMEEAARLLSMKSGSVSEIAAKVGYTSQSRFCAAFKAVYGISPTEYRRRGEN